MDETVPLFVPPPPPRRRRRLLIVGLLVAAGLASALITGFGSAVLSEAGGEGPEPAMLEPDVPSVLPEGSVTLQPAVLGTPVEEPAPVELTGETGSSGGSGGDGGTNGGPCDGADPSHLVTRPDPVKLNPGATKGSFELTNCADHAVAWTVASKPIVTLTPTGASLAAGASAKVSFQVDVSDLPSGPFTFKIRVSQPGASSYVDVTGTRTTLGFTAPTAGPDPGDTLSNGSAGGCGASCITKAWITAVKSGKAVTLEVKTHTPARIPAAAGTQAPGHDGHQLPVLPDPAVSLDAGAAYRTQWTVNLQPLEPGTSYHIVVRAVDAQGRVTARAGTFRTLEPVNDVQAGQAGGCSAACVKSAVLLPQPGSPDVKLQVSTHVPVSLMVWAEQREPEQSGSGQPFFPGATPAATTDNQRVLGWSPKLELEYDRTYHILLRATDEQQRSQVETGTVTTPPRPAEESRKVLVTFSWIDVHDDGDNGAFNFRGELQFRIDLNEDGVADLNVGERKVYAPQRLHPGGDRGGLNAELTIAGDALPLRVQGWDRDWTGNTFCSAGDGFMFPEPAGHQHLGGCFDVDWNTAAGTVDLTQPSQGGGLPACYGLELTADICTVLSAEGQGPRFDVAVGISYLDGGP